MNRNTKNLLCTVIPVAVATQLLSIVCFRHEFTIGGEILVPALVLLIRQAVITTINALTYDLNEINTEEKQMKYPMKHQRMLMKKYGLNPKRWVIVSENSTEMKAVSRCGGIVCILDKKRGADSE